MRDGILREQWVLQANFGANPLALGMWTPGRVFAGATRPEGRAKRGALDFFEVLEMAKDLVTHGAGDIDFESYGGHVRIISSGTAIVDCRLSFSALAIPPGAEAATDFAALTARLEVGA